MNYPTEKLGNHIQVLSGFAFKSKDFSDTGIPVIKIKNVTPPSVSLIDLSYVPEEIAGKNRKFVLSYDDVLIALTGSHINQMASVVGRVAKVKYSEKTVLNQRVGKITVNDPDDCDLDFVYYYLSQDKVKIELASKAGGAANQANISPTDIKNLMFPFPNIDVQRKIASVLRAYDDLIENNQKQIKLLEEAAQRLYKEWFVDLRFPGHETTPIVDGVPEGWRVDRADSFFDMSIGKTPPRAEKQWFTDGTTGTPWVSISDMGSSGVYVFHTSEGLTEDAISKHNIKVVSADTVLLSFKLTVGRVSITTGNSCTNEAIAHFIIKDSILREYVYLYLKCFEYDSLGNTSSISKAVNSKIVKGMPFIMPDTTVLSQFHQVSRPIFDEIKNRQKVNINLVEARDRLLPKLMSGEIEV